MKYRPLIRTLNILKYVALVCIGLELVARTLVTFFPEPTPERMLLIPSPAYSKASYWSDDYAKDLQQRPLTCYYGNKITYHSRYFNVDDCRRRVVNQPLNAEKTIWLFGSSTLYSSEVPDEYTIASQLQSIVGDTWRIENVTTSGATMYTIGEMIEQEPIQSGDIVVPINGIGDAGWAYTEIRKQPGYNPFELFCRIVLDIAREKIYTTRLFCDWQKRYMPDEWVQESTIRPYADKLRERYQDALKLARNYAEGKGAQFINVLQPHLWSRPLTAQEKVIDQSWIIFPRYGEVHTIVWKELQPFADLDLTHVLDEVRATEVVLFDGWHGNHTANGLIARAIAEAISR